MIAKLVASLRPLLVFAMAVAVAHAQTSPPPLSAEVVKRIQKEIRWQYSVPVQFNISVSDPKPGNVPGYDAITVTFAAANGNTATKEFLISKDRKTLSRLETMDISQDLSIDVSGRPVRGSPSAQVTIISFTDLQCPFCSRIHSTLFPGLMQQYAGRLKVIYVDYPLIEVHPWSVHAAIDANCLAAQNHAAYWDFVDHVFANQTALEGHNRAESFLNLDALAAEQGKQHSLDMQRLDNCIKAQDDSTVRSSMAQADQLGVESTPTMFVNGISVHGAVSDAELRAVVDRALADAAPVSRSEPSR